MNVSPETVRYYRRQIESAYSNLAPDVDLEDAYPFPGNDSAAARKMWDDYLKARGIEPHPKAGNNTPGMMTVAERVAVISYIRKHHITQAEFADLCGVSRPTIGNIVRGRAMSEYTMDRVRGMFG